MNITPNIPKLSPIWYAVGAFFATPLLAAVGILGAALMLLTWPFIPFLCYFKRREEIQKERAQ